MQAPHHTARNVVTDTFSIILRLPGRSLRAQMGRWPACALALLLALAGPAHAAEDFSKRTARSSPGWLRDAVVYEINPRSFSQEGTFTAITARLDELQDLGVNILWLMPIHPIGMKMKKGSIGSPYAVRDYYAIDSSYGTEADLKRLIFEAHRRGMKVLLDIVANHTAWDSVLMEHPDFYKQDKNGKIIPPVPEWTDVAGLNYENPKLREYMIKMLKQWLDPATFDVDGFRCDVAFMVPTSFWEEARAELAKVKPNVIMLAEASKPELLLHSFDFDYSWPLHSALNDVLRNAAPASGLKASWEESARQFPQQSLHMRFSDNHDEARAVARFGIKGALAASVLMFTLDGVPLLYNGMEVGDASESGDPALFEKIPIFWHPKERPALRDIYRGLIKLRKQYAAFSNDRVVWLRNSDEASLVTFMRLDGKDEFVVAINFSNRPVAGRVQVANEQAFKPVKIAGMGEPTAAEFPLLRLNGFEWRIFHRAVQ